MMARILAPAEDNDFIEDGLFPPPNDYIEYEEEEQVWKYSKAWDLNLIVCITY